MLNNLMAVSYGRIDRIGLAILIFLVFVFFMLIYSVFVLHRRTNLKVEGVEEEVINPTAEELENAGVVAEEPVEEAPAEEPVEEAPAEEPVEEVPAEEPVEEAPAEEPVEEVPAEEPVEEAPAEEPVEEAPVEEPVEEVPEEPAPVVIESALEKNNMADLVKESVSVEEAKQIINDEIADELVEVQHESNKLKGAKKEKFIVNVDKISENFNNGDEVNLQTLKEKGLLPKKCNYFKVLARGVLDKKLKVVANEYSKDAIKMIVIVGGEVVVLE